MLKWAMLTLWCLCAASAKKPNIVFVLLDDAGWYDFESHDPTMATPNIKSLRDEGLFLNQSYVLPMCAPTRSTFLSGRYAHTYGAQNGKAAGNDAMFWVPENYSFISNEMQKLGYRTHALGKWHLGFCHPSLTPVNRGFDTFYGMLLGAHNSFYTHYKRLLGPYDWWNQSTIDWGAQGKYSTELLNDEMVRIIEDSNPDQPFFAYLAHPAPHGPFEVPQRYIDQYCPNVTNADRQTHCGMMAAVDEGIGRMIAALKKKGTYDDTAFIVMSDNGGPVGNGNWSFNYPLRGGKKTVYEGGTRVYTVVKAPGLNVTGTTYPGMVHAVDWMPTIVSMGGGKPKNWMHGKNAWDRIRDFQPSRRTDFLYTYDDFPKLNHRAFRYQQWKLIQGKPGYDLGWYAPPDLVKSGKAVDKPLRPKTEDFYHFELYDLENDPEERRNLAKEKPNKVKEMLRRMKKFLKKHPLQPFKESEYSASWKDSETNEVLTCWCHPKHSPAYPGCPKPATL